MDKGWGFSVNSADLRGLRAEFLLLPPNISPNAILENGNMKIDEQTGGGVGEFEVREHCGFVYGADRLDGLQLHDDPPLHPEIHSIAAFELHVFVDDGDRLLALEGDAAKRQFAGEAFFIG
jgi:hypothetical protein